MQPGLMMALSEFYGALLTTPSSPAACKELLYTAKEAASALIMLCKLQGHTVEDNMLAEVVHPHIVVGGAGVGAAGADGEPPVLGGTQQVRHLLVVDLQEAALALVLHQCTV